MEINITHTPTGTMYFGFTINDVDHILFRNSTGHFELLMKARSNVSGKPTLCIFKDLTELEDISPVYKGIKEIVIEHLASKDKEPH